MNWITFFIGIGILLYSIWAANLKLLGKTDNFVKLEPMKKFWGEKTGAAMHTFFYLLLPAIAGMLFILKGLKGANLF